MDNIVVQFKSASFGNSSETIIDSNSSCYMSPEVFRHVGVVKILLKGTYQAQVGGPTQDYFLGPCDVFLGIEPVDPVDIPDEYEVFIEAYTDLVEYIREIIHAPEFRGDKGEKGDKGDVGPRGAKGDKGDQGAQGIQGDVGPSGADGQDGADGADGADGVGIASVEKTSTSGLVDTYTITYTDGDTDTFDVTNGADGHDVFIATYGTTTFADIVAAIEAGKTVICKDSGIYLMLDKAVTTGTTSSQYVRFCATCNTDDNKINTRQRKVTYSDTWSSTSFTVAKDAEVNVQSDWNQATTTADSYIKNKPTIPSKTSDLTNDSNFITASDVPQEVFVATYNSTSYADVLAAYSAGKIILVKEGAMLNSVSLEYNSGTSKFYAYYALSTEYIGSYQLNSSGWSKVNTPLVPTYRTVNSKSLSNNIMLTASDVGAQETLVSGTNIKTINNESILGSGNITIQGGGDVTDVEVDGVSVVTSGVASIDLTGKADVSILATVATTGDYDDLSNKPTIPTDTDNLTNGAGFITISDVPNEIFIATYGTTTYADVLAAYNAGKVVIVDDGTHLNSVSLYCTNQSGTPTVFAYYAEGVESIGAYQLNSSGWTKLRTFLVPTYRTVNGKSLSDNITLTASDVGALSSSTSIPAALSDLTNDLDVSDFPNDAGYLTSFTETDPVFTASAAYGISSSDITSWNGKSTFSGDYNDLSNKPTIPTVNNATLTIQKNGTTVNTFTANASSNVTCNITVPTTASDVSAIPTSAKGANSGVCPLNSSGKIDVTYLPVYNGGVS